MPQTALDVLEKLLAWVKAQIAAQPCECSMNEGGLAMCRRCLLLRR